MSLLLLASCIEQIDFNAPEEIGVLVIDGRLSIGPDSSEVRLLRTNILGKRVFPAITGAKVTIFDNEGKSEAYEEIKSGFFRLPGNRIWAQVGRTYYIEVELKNGEKYKLSGI